MGRSASQTAAHKLGQILGLLVIPIVVLWSIYFYNAKSDIDRLSREINGAKIADIVAQGSQDRSELQELEKSIGLLGTFQVMSNKSGIIAGRINALEQQKLYLQEVYQASGLALDSDLQSNALAETGLLLLPAFSLNVERLVQRLTSIPLQQKIGENNLAFLLLASGEISTTAKRIENNLLQSSTQADGVKFETIAALNALSSAVEKSTVQLTKPSAGGVEQLAYIQHFATQHADFRKYQDTTLPLSIAKQLVEKLQKRRGVLWRSLLLLTLAGLVSSIAGVGLAVLMMRSTLLQLDDVERAHHDAQVSKRDAEQIALRFSTINSDISKLNQELASNVKQLKSTQDELVKKGQIEQLGQLTATIAHEIRNPLGSIRTSAFILDRKLSKVGFDSGDLIERINNSVNRCDTIISQLHDFANVKEPNKAVARLDEWMSKTVRDEAKRMPNSIFIECSLGLGDQLVSFDPVQLQRAIVNLLNNACEALQLVDVQTDVPQIQKCIWVTTLFNEGFAGIRISDNGPGIAAEYIKKIREPLFTTKSFGSGLGIPVVEQIIKSQGGHLDIVSDLGAGATFTINLPIQHDRRTAHVA